MKSAPHAFVSLFLLITLSAAGGCGGRTSFDSWQRSVELAAQAHGNDTSFLREAAHDGAHARFAILGGSDPDRSTDISGVLLTRRAVGAREWLIFLVARIRNMEIQDIRVAALTDDAGAARRTWVMGDDNDASDHVYRRFKESQWRKRDPNRTHAPWAPTLFPAENDVFRVEEARGVIAVHEESSGARWTLTVPPERARR